LEASHESVTAAIGGDEMVVSAGARSRRMVRSKAASIESLLVNPDI
jgi:hypothetical protein